MSGCRTSVEPAVVEVGVDGWSAKAVLWIYRCRACGYESKPMGEGEAVRFAGIHEKAAA